MMRAAGFTSEKDFFKAVEAGKIMASEVMPKFADELKKIANTNGALAATTQKTRAEMQRFLNQLTFAKDEIFQNGMDSGLATMFATFADILEGLKPLTKVIGGLFRGMVSTISGALKLVITPVEILVNSLAGLWNMLGVGDESNSKIWAVIGGGGTLLLLASRFEMIRKIILGTNTALLAMLATLARIAIPLLVIEDIYGGLQGKTSATGAGGRWSAQGILGDSFAWMDKPLNQLVTIEVKGDEAAKFIQTTVEKGNQAKTAATQSEVAQ